MFLSVQKSKTHRQSVSLCHRQCGLERYNAAVMACYPFLTSKWPLRFHSVRLHNSPVCCTLSPSPFVPRIFTSSYLDLVCQVLSSVSSVNISTHRTSCFQTQMGVSPNLAMAVKVFSPLKHTFIVGIWPCSW